MAENFDPVLGGQQLAGSDPVMGGLVAVEQALDSPDPKVRIQAIKGALKYGSRGAELVIHALQNDPNWEVQFAAWETLLEAEDPQHVQVAKAHRLPLRQVGDVRARYKAGERDFRWADLSGADLWRANLSQADLRGANLSRAGLSGANLSEANLWLADLSGANLSGANLSQANLRGAKLGGTNLRGANLWGAKLSPGWDQFADLRRAILPDGTIHP
ncbi:pentapeptide repeat-containing protein [Synechococcus sp. H60.2]|uniref:pentapeptide repeat-containing protein n=1 Tax=Synechococcus sp. H60.2 TaxID=2964518 RepID=UPI0039C3B797